MTNEKRRATRYPISAAAEIVELRTGSHIGARTSDLSLVGCFLDTLNTLPVGTEIKLQITNGEETFKTHAIVAYSTSNIGMGINFTAVRREQQKVLQRWLDGLRLNDS